MGYRGRGCGCGNSIEIPPLLQYGRQVKTIAAPARVSKHKLLFEKYCLLLKWYQLKKISSPSLCDARSEDYPSHCKPHKKAHVRISYINYHRTKNCLHNAPEITRHPSLKHKSQVISSEEKKIFRSKRTQSFKSHALSNYINHPKVAKSLAFGIF